MYVACYILEFKVWDQINYLPLHCALNAKLKERIIISKRSKCFQKFSLEGPKISKKLYQRAKYLDIFGMVRTKNGAQFLCDSTMKPLY